MSERRKRPAQRRSDRETSRSTTSGGNDTSGREGGDVTLAELRRQLDLMDRELVGAINRRAEIARRIGQLKRGDSQSVYDPAREAEVLQQAQANNAGPLSNEAVRAVFRELVSASRAVQAPTRVAYLGPEFTFSHLAAIEGFGQSGELLPVGSVAAVFEEVERGQAHFGVVPMENSTDGRIADTLDCFTRYRVRICAGLSLRIHHCLLGIGKRDEVVRVYSKPQPLSQCRNWLARHLPQADLQETASTADAAKAAKDDPRSAAVASAQAGVNYGLPILAPNIEDNPDNVTRFVVISSSTSRRTGDDKTVLLFEVAHRPGSLADALMIFKRNHLNMTMIDSYPIPGSLGRYLFFGEFSGHEDDASVRRAIASLKKKAQRVEVLGSYAQSEPIG